MAETTADIRRDIELTRERMSSAIEELERKLNVKQLVTDHPLPALAVAFGAGVLLSGSKADVKAAAATLAATKGARGQVTSVLDELVASLVTAADQALHAQVDRLMNDVKSSIQTPRSTSPANGTGYGVGPIDITPDKSPVDGSGVIRGD